MNKQLFSKNLRRLTGARMAGDPWAALIGSVVIHAIEDINSKDRLKRLDAIWWLYQDGSLFLEALDIDVTRDEILKCVQ